MTIKARSVSAVPVTVSITAKINTGLMWATEQTGKKAMFDRLRDWFLERRIARLGRQMREAKTTIEYTRRFVELRDAIGQRSASQVQRIERERGLL